MSKNSEELERIQKQLDKIKKTYKELGKPGQNPFENMDAQKVVDKFEDATKAASALNSVLFEVEDRLDALNNSTDNLVRQIEAVMDELKKSSSPLNRMNKAYKGLVGAAQDLADESERSTSMNSKDLAKLKDKVKIQSKAAKDQAEVLVRELQSKQKTQKLTDQEVQNLTAAQGILKDGDKTQQALLDKIGARIKLEDEFNRKLGFGGKAAEGLDKALQKAGLPSIGIADAIEKAKKNFIDSKGETSVLKDTLKGVASNLKDAMSFANLMQSGFTLLIKAVMDVDKASGEFAKNNGISYQNALAIRGEMNEIARSSNDVVVSSKALMETQGTLNKFFGQSTKFTGKLAEDMTSIAKRTGLSEEAQGTFALEAMKTGKGVKDILKTQTLTVMEMNKEKGLQMSVKQIQEAISKTSNAVFMTFKGSTEELTKQVMSVKALGANMEQVESIASSLLNFESSIQAELEAELLLGKQINLEKAREAALRGDMGKVAEEVMKNDAIMNAFATDNVIQQEAAAKALGMNREQLAGMIKEQEKLEAVRAAGFDNMNDAQKEYNKMRADGLSKEAAAAAIGDDNLAAQLESVSAAEKFEGTMARLQELFVALAEPILAIVQPIADILVPALQGVSFIMENLVAAFTAVKDLIMESVPAMITFGGVLAGILINQQRIAFQKKQGLAYDTAQFLMAKKKLIVEGAIGVRKKINTALESGTLMKTIGTAAMKAFTSLASIPFVGPILGAAAAASAVALGMKLFNKAGDVMSPADGKTQISTKEGGLFELSPNDDLIAAPGAADAMNKKGGGAGGGSAALIAEVRTLIGINRQILAKSPVIEMNGNKVGEEINQSERRVQ